MAAAAAIQRVTAKNLEHSYFSNDRIYRIVEMFMQNKILQILFGTLAFLSNAADAAVSTTGVVSRIFPSDSNAVYFRIAGDTCNVGNDYYYFDTSRASAKNWYAILMLSIATDKPIIVSADSCDSGNKSIRYLLIDK